MGIGVSVFLVAVGAILAFATHASVSGLDINVVGWILMAAGIIGLVMTLTIWGPRRGGVAVGRRRRVVQDPATGRTVYDDQPVVERRVYDDPL